MRGGLRAAGIASAEGLIQWAMQERGEHITADAYLNAQLQEAVLGLAAHPNPLAPPHRHEQGGARMVHMRLPD